MARDAFATFNNSKFEPYNSFKVNCVGYNQFKGLWESLYNRDLALLMAIWTSRPCAQREIFFEGGGLGDRWGGLVGGGTSRGYVTLFPSYFDYHNQHKNHQ